MTEPAGQWVCPGCGESKNGWCRKGYCRALPTEGTEGAKLAGQDERLRKALAYAESGFRMAYVALEKRFYDEAMLHCGAHEAAAAAALAATQAKPSEAKMVAQLRQEYAEATEGWERCKAQCDSLRDELSATQAKPEPAQADARDALTADGTTLNLTDGSTLVSWKDGRRLPGLTDIVSLEKARAALQGQAT